MPLVSVNVDAIPIMRTVDLSNWIYDSGITRFRMNAKIMEVYSNDGEPYWYFPEKIFVEQLDSLFNLEASILADTAYRYEKKGLWRAVRNVVVKNSQGTVFETSELFWNEKAPPNDGYVFYTHKPVKIIYPDGTVSYGQNGFRSNQSLSPLFLFNVKADLLIDESTDSPQQNTINSDSIKLQRQ